MASEDSGVGPVPTNADSNAIEERQISNHESGTSDNEKTPIPQEHQGTAALNEAALPSYSGHEAIQRIWTKGPLIAVFAR